MAPKTSGFMVFMFDWKNKYGKKMSIAEATNEAGKIWKDMDAAARAPYLQRAKQQNINPKEKKVKLTCTGKPVDEIARERQLAEENERNIKRYIEKVVRDSLNNGTLQHQKYFFIMANYFAKTLLGAIYVPAEISLAEFSLQDGVTRTYHSLINPGREIFGHQYEAKQHSETTHNLPLPPNALGSTDLGNIFNDILNFIYNKENGEYAPIYAPVEAKPVVESVLNYLKSDRVAKDVELRIYPIQYLMFVLKDATCELGENEKITSYHVIEAGFSNDFFEYESGIGCEFHEECDRSKYCTKSYVTRWGFMFSDMMCGDIAIDMVPGRHCPIKTNLDKLMTINYSKSSNADVFSNSSTKDTMSVVSYNTMMTEPLAGGASNIVKPDEWTTINSRKNKNRQAGGNTESGRNRVAAQHRYGNRDEDEVYDVAERNIPNPWSQRSLVTPPEPDPSFFHIDTKTDLDSSDVSMQSSSYGRGSILSNRKAWGRGRGRGFPPL